MLLPTHHDRSGNSNAKPSNKDGRIRLGDVWDEREELFGIGDSDDDDNDDVQDPPRRPTVSHSPMQTAGPKIVVTSS